MRVAALDLGTNTFLCLIADVNEGRIEKVHADALNFVRLGQELDKTGEIHTEALQRAEDCFKEFRELIQLHQAEVIVSAATSAARDAKNSIDFVDLGAKYGIPVEVITGDEEARVTFNGAGVGLDVNDAAPLVIDVGGGSTELIFDSIDEQSKNNSLKSVSLNIGAVRLTERLIARHPIESSELTLLKTEIKNQLDAYMSANKITIESFHSQKRVALAVAGTPTTLAAMTLGEDFSEEKIHGMRLSSDKINEWIVKLSRLSIDERCRVKGLPPGRADVIVTGAMILQESLKAFGFEELMVSTKGVRYGLAIEAERKLR